MSVFYLSDTKTVTIKIGKWHKNVSVILKIAVRNKRLVAADKDCQYVLGYDVSRSPFYEIKVELSGDEGMVY